jgi:DNA-binding phage protein
MHQYAKVDAHEVCLVGAEMLGRIARQQESLGMSNTELAQRIGVNRATIQRARAEGGSPTLANVVAMALAVGLTPALKADGEGALQPHEAALVHRGLYNNRLNRDVEWRDTQREIALAQSWESWNEYVESGREPVMRSLMPGYDQTQASAAATVVQWLGSDEGFRFLTQALDAAGYDVVEKSSGKGAGRKRRPGTSR